MAHDVCKLAIIMVNLPKQQLKQNDRFGWGKEMSCKVFIHFASFGLKRAYSMLSHYNTLSLILVLQKNSALYSGSSI